MRLEVGRSTTPTLARGIGGSKMPSGKKQTPDFGDFPECV